MTFKLFAKRKSKYRILVEYNITTEAVGIIFHIWQHTEQQAN